MFGLTRGCVTLNNMVSVQATYINAAHQFKNVFALNGYLLIIPTIVRIYSNHQTNGLLTRTIEFICKQFYIMHRKPFLLQMFGAVAPILDTDIASQFGDATKIQPKAFFQLLQSLSESSPLNDHLNHPVDHATCTCRPVYLRPSGHLGVGRGRQAVEGARLLLPDGPGNGFDLGLDLVVRHGGRVRGRFDAQQADADDLGLDRAAVHEAHADADHEEGE